MIAATLLVGCVPVELEPDAGESCGAACRGNSVVSCGPDGGGVETACAMSERCAPEATPPQCVKANALPCAADSGVDAAPCEAGDTVRPVCDPSGYVRYDPCGADAG